MKMGNPSRQWLPARSGLAKRKNCANIGGTVWDAGRQGRHILRSFRNEREAGDGRLNLHNFMEEHVGVQGGSASRNCAVFGRNWPEA